jgi:hypothetical protein
MYGINLERRLFDKILYDIDSSDIPQYLLQSVLSPTLWIDTIIDSFLIRQYFLIPNGINEVCGLQTLMFHILLGSFLPGLDHYLEIYMLSILL